MIVRTCSIIGGVLLLIGCLLSLMAAAGAIEGSIAITAALMAGAIISIFAIVALTLGHSAQVRLAAEAAEIADGLSNGEPYSGDSRDELHESLRKISAYLERNAKLANRIADGNLLTPADRKSQGDILGRAFYEMSEKLRTSMQTRESRERLELSMMKLLGEVSDVAKGDLTVIADSTPEITGEVAVAFNSMTRNLTSLIKQVKDVTLKVSTSANNIHETTEQLARGSVAQASQIARTKTAIANMAEQIHDVSENAATSTRVADDSLRNAKVGTQAARENVNAMNAIRKQVQETAKRIKRLGERSQEISQIVALIDDLSDRTSVLALNASLQANAAGGSGPGLGSVAEEIERLAERSTKLTQQIAALTQTIHLETKEVVASMEETIREVTLGSASAEKAGRSLFEIEKVTGDLAALLRSISDSTSVQAKTSEDVSGAMSDISQVTELIQLSSKKASESVRILVQLSGDLHNSVSPFKLPADVHPVPPIANGSSSFAN